MNDMNPTMSRRAFATLLGGTFATSLLPGCLHTQTTAADYSVCLLGDMHYDAFPKERFHAKALALWAQKGWRHPARLREFDRNAAMWRDIGGRILSAAGRVRRADAAFALQLGDLVQGDCEDDALHAQMLSEAADLLENTYPGLPIVSVCGNHDIRRGHDNRGAEDAYAAHMLPFESQQLAGFLPGGVASTTFGFRCGRDLWIMLDFNSARRDVPVVKRLLAENPDVRYTFVATHGPVLPMDLWACRWFYLGDERDTALRREMRALFAARHAIVLAGHVHTLENKVWEGDGGQIVEAVVNTCAGKDDGGCFPAEPKVLSATPGDYGRRTLTESVTERNLRDLAPLYDEYRPGLRVRYAARAVGHHVLRVTDRGVHLDYYGHDARTPAATFALR